MSHTGGIYRHDPRYRFQQEANGSWSIYEGEGYRRGAFRTLQQAEAWLDGWTEAGAEFDLPQVPA
jgi:hypothetical protein